MKNLEVLKLKEEDMSVSFNVLINDIGKAFEITINEKLGLKLEYEKDFNINVDDETNGLYVTFDNCDLDEETFEKLEVEYLIQQEYEAFTALLSDVFGVETYGVYGYVDPDDNNYANISIEYEEYKKIQDTIKSILKSNEVIKVNNKEYTQKDLMKIGSNVASGWGAGCYDYDINKVEDEVTFHCIEDQEHFTTTLKYSNLEEYKY